MEEYIKLLDLPDEFDLADLKKAYRKKVFQYHPDKASNEAERVGYEALMKKLNEANEYLKDYLEHHNGKYSKVNESTNNYSNYSTDDTDNSAQEDYQEEDYQNESYQEEDYQEESSQNENVQYTQEENYENIDYIGKIIDFYKSMFNPIKVYKAFKEIYGKNPKLSIIAFIIALLFIPLWNKFTDIVYPNSSQAYTQESKQETKQEIPTQNTPQNLTINQQNLQENNEKVFQGLTRSEWDLYMRDLQERIKRNWSFPQNIEKSNPDKVKLVVTRFKISKDGSLLGVPVIEKSSGIERIDSSCIDAIKLTAPFRPLPPGFTGEYLDTSFTFEALRHSN